MDKYHNYPAILKTSFSLSYTHTHVLLILTPSYTTLNSPIYGLSINGGNIFLFVFIIICILCHSKDGDQVREAEVLSLSHTISLISLTLSSKTCTIHQLKVIGSERESERKKRISLINLSARESNRESSRRPVYKPSLQRGPSLTHTHNTATGEYAAL